MFRGVDVHESQQVTNYGFVVGGALASYTPKVLRMQVSKALRRTAHRSCALRTFEYTL